MNKKQKRNLWIGLVFGLLIFGILSSQGVFQPKEQSVVPSNFGNFTLTIFEPSAIQKPLVAVVVDKTLTLGEQVCWSEYADMSVYGGCAVRVEWEIMKGTSTATVIGQDFPYSRCTTIGYSRCWTPVSAGTYQITSYFILDNGDVPAEASTQSQFTVTAPTPTCTSNSYKACYGGNLYWYDSCDNRGSMATSCQYGCENGACKSAPPVTECTSGQEKCDGFQYSLCSSSNTWELKGLTLNKCGVSCLVNTDCQSGYQCDSQQYQCTLSEPIPPPEEPSSLLPIIMLLAGGIVITLGLIYLLLKIKKGKRKRRR